METLCVIADGTPQIMVADVIQKALEARGLEWRSDDGEGWWVEGPAGAYWVEPRIGRFALVPFDWHAEQHPPTCPCVTCLEAHMPACLDELPH